MVNPSKFQQDAIAPMHTTEHILNQTMVRMFGCMRSKNSHIERKKSKCDYLLAHVPTADEVAAITNKVNEIIRMNLAVTDELAPLSEAKKYLDISKLPEGIDDNIRIVRVGDYDACPCVGMHVKNTSEIGKFEIISHEFNEGCWRVRFKLV